MTKRDHSCAFCRAPDDGKVEITLGGVTMRIPRLSDLAEPVRCISAEELWEKWGLLPAGPRLGHE